MKKRTETRAEVVVIGAGPAGSLAAHVLARAGRDVVLLDRGRGPARQVGESLPPAGRRLLAHLGLGSLLDLSRHLASPGNRSAWGSSRLGAVDFIRDPDGHGWRLDRPRFDADLRAAALAAGARPHVGRLDGMARDADGWVIETDRGRLRAGWLIDASGRASVVSRRLGIERTRDDDLTAVCAWYGARAEDRDARMLVESAADGWWYTARLPGEGRVVVFQTSAENARRILRSPGKWEHLLAGTAHVGRAVSESSRLDRLQGAEASGARLARFAGPGWVAVGDAAVSFDPISSQGIFNALYTGMKAAQAVAANLASGDASAVEAYAARLEEIRAVYLERHRLIYATESRWAASTFWSARAPSLSPAPIRRRA
jgi:flavin-dependent dehydrogenase